MGFVLSILYFVTYYLSPSLLFGPLAAYHVELILAALVSLISIPKLLSSSVIRSSQTLALIGLAVAVLMSVMVGAGWVSGGVQAFLGFIPNAFGYFLVCLHCDSKKKLRALVLMLVLVCLFVVAQGGVALRSADIDLASGGIPAEGYLLAMRSDAGQWFYRLRGLGVINDPNDFGQVIICVIPLVFIFWRKNKVLANSACVLLPLGGLLIGVFLTHSRGALVALIALAVVSARKRIGTIPALMLAAGMFALSMALHFTGGREISASSGEDRTALWGESLQLFKSHPLFGVGFGNLPDYLGHTAHNSVAVCAGELGFLGLFFWSLFLVPTLRDSLVLASPEKVSEGRPVVGETELFPRETRTIEHIDKDEVNHLGGLLLLSIAGFC
jgi:O-antigen ligase